MSNKDIANAYAKHMASMVNDMWVSDNLSTLSRSERREILAIYKKHFKVVEYDSVTGVCKCWVVDPCELSPTARFVTFDSVDSNTGEFGDAVKESTKISIGSNTANTTYAGIQVL